MCRGARIGGDGIGGFRSHPRRRAFSLIEHVSTRRPAILDPRSQAGCGPEVRGPWKVVDAPGPQDAGRHNQIATRSDCGSLRLAGWGYGPVWILSRAGCGPEVRGPWKVVDAPGPRDVGRHNRIAALSDCGSLRHAGWGHGRVWVLSRAGCGPEVRGPWLVAGSALLRSFATWRRPPLVKIARMRSTRDA